MHDKKEIQRDKRRMVEKNKKVSGRASKAFTISFSLQ